MKVQLRPIPLSAHWVVRFNHPKAGPTVEIWPDRESADERAHNLEGIPYRKPKRINADDTIRKALDLLDVGATSRAREALAEYLLAMVQRSNPELPTPF